MWVSCDSGLPGKSDLLCRAVLTNLMHTTSNVFNCPSFNVSPLQDTQVFTLPNLTVTISCHEMWWVSFLQEIPQIRHGSLNPQFPTQILGKVSPSPKIRFIRQNVVQFLGKVQAVPDFTQIHFSNHDAESVSLRALSEYKEQWPDKYLLKKTK